MANVGGLVKRTYLPASSEAKTNLSAVALPVLTISKSRSCFGSDRFDERGLNSSSSSDSTACLGGPTSAKGSVSCSKESKPEVTHLLDLIPLRYDGSDCGNRSLHSMIRLFVAPLRPKRVSASLKRVPALYGAYVELHTSGADYDSEVESTSLLRSVRNRASEYSNLHSEVSNARVGQSTPPLNAQTLAVRR